MHSEVVRVDISREDRDISLGKIRQKLRQLLQSREPKNGAILPPAAAICTALLPILLGLFEMLGVTVLGQMLVRPGVRADGHSGIDYLFGDSGMPSRVLADLEEGRFQTFVGQRLQYSRRTAPRTVVEGQNDFLVVEEIVLLEILEAEPGATCGIDLDNPCEAHAAGALALRDCAGGRRGHVLNGSVGRQAIRPGRRRRVAFFLHPCRRSRGSWRFDSIHLGEVAVGRVPRGRRNASFRRDLRRG